MEESEDQRVHRLIKQARWKERSNYLWLFGTIAVVLFLAFMSDEDDQHNEDTVETYTPSELDAYLMAKQLFESKLKAPSTASFAAFHQSKVRNSGVDQWTVTSYVDSQNSFGAMIRTHFVITMRVNTETKYWQTTALKIDP